VATILGQQDQNVIRTGTIGRLAGVETTAPRSEGADFLRILPGRVSPERIEPSTNTLRVIFSALPLFAEIAPKLA
jgi:hypothetical protein